MTTGATTWYAAVDAALRNSVGLEPADLVDLLIGVGADHGADTELAMIDAVLRRDGPTAPVLAERARVLATEGSFRQAVMASEWSLELEPGNRVAAIAKAIAHQGQGDHEQAVADLDAIESFFTTDEEIGHYYAVLAESLQAIDARDRVSQLISTWRARCPDDDRVDVLEATERYLAGDVPEALDLVARVLAKRPDDLRALRLDVQFRVHDPAGQVAAADRFADVAGIDVDVLARRGDSLRQLGRAEEAEQDLAQALALQPDHAWARGTYGQVLGDLGRHDDAIEHLRRALNDRPDFEWAQLELGWQMIHSGRYAEAIEVADAVGLATNRAARAKTEALRLLGQPAEALAVLDEWLADDDSAWVRGTRGQLLLVLGRAAEAVEELVGANEVERRTWIDIELIDALRLSGRLEEALELTDEVLDASPGVLRARANRAELLRGLGRCEEAIEAASAALAEHPTYEWLLATRAAAYATLGRFPESLADAKSAVDIDPDYEFARRILVVAYNGLDLSSHALAEVRSLRDDGYDDGSSRADEVLCLLLLGRYDEALDEVGNADDDPRLHYYLGVALARMGDVDAAREPLRRSVELLGDEIDPYVYNELADCERVLAIGDGTGVGEAAFDDPVIDLVDRGDVDADSFQPVAWSLLKRRRYDEAMRYLKLARRDPVADWLMVLVQLVAGTPGALTAFERWGDELAQADDAGRRVGIALEAQHSMSLAVAFELVDGAQVDELAPRVADWVAASRDALAITSTEVGGTT